MKERGRNERKMVQGRKGGAGLTEGGLESQSVEQWSGGSGQMMESGRVNSVRGRPSEDIVKCTGGIGNRVKTQQEKEGAGKKTTETRWQAKYGRFAKLLRWAVSCGEMPGLERDHPARQYN